MLGCKTSDFTVLGIFTLILILLIALPFISPFGPFWFPTEWFA